ncbi:MAG: porin [Proteobacteria bacterium]|nr:porin [Pseudomonadota bacterium]
MKKKILVTAIASALIAPAAFAAEGSDGMNYTSASEGFYGSLRARFDTGSADNDEPVFNNGTTSRVGVRGTLDMGSGLTGFYQWEANISGEQGDATGKRQGNVGIRGAFGEVKVGSFTDTMIGVSGHTDVTNSISGNFDISQQYRVDNAIAYTTPDLNGFQANIRLVAEERSIAGLSPLAEDPETFALFEDVSKNDTDAIDDWAINASYSTQGLTAVAAYRVEESGAAASYVSHFGADGEFGGEDADADTISIVSDSIASWGAGLGYGQDNWNVGFWYGEQESKIVVETYPTKVAGTNNDTLGGVTILESPEDIEIFAIAGDVAVGKTKLYAFTENLSQGSFDNNVSGVGVQYSFTANSRVWMDYQANDYDTDASIDDRVVIGLRHDF